MANMESFDELVLKLWQQVSQLMWTCHLHYHIKRIINCLKVKRAIQIYILFFFYVFFGYCYLNSGPTYSMKNKVDKIKRVD